MFSTITGFVLAAAEGAAGEEESSTFLVTPGLGLMLWTLLAFGAALFVLKKYAFPPITEALDKRQRAIEESITHAEQTKTEADKLLEEYRGRLKEARVQAEEIVSRARTAGAATEKEAAAAGQAKREELLEQAKKDIQAETARAIGEIRSEVANLTVAATEKVTRKTLTEEDQKRLVEEALSELDFTALSGGRNN